MLVLTRKLDQSILIGDNKEVRIKVLAISRNKVQIGIDAPKEVAIFRGETVSDLLVEQELESV